MGGKGQPDDFDQFLKALLDIPAYRGLTLSTIKDQSLFCEELSRLCWERCREETISMKKKMVELNLSSMKEIMALKASLQQMDRRHESATEFDCQDVVQFYDPMQVLDKDTQELVVLLATDKVKSLVKGSAPKHLVKRIGDTVPIIAELYEWRPRAEQAGARISELEAQLKEIPELKSELEEANTFLKTERRKLKELQLQHETLWNNLHAAAETVRNLQRQLIDTQAQLQNAEERVAELEQRDALAKQDFEKLRTDHELVVMELEQKHDIIEAFEAEALQQVIRKNDLLQRLTISFSGRNDKQLIEETLQAWRHVAVRAATHREIERRLELHTRKSSLPGQGPECKTASAQTLVMCTSEQETQVSFALAEASVQVDDRHIREKCSYSCSSCQTEPMGIEQGPGVIAEPESPESRSDSPFIWEAAPTVEVKEPAASSRECTHAATQTSLLCTSATDALKLVIATDDAATQTLECCSATEDPFTSEKKTGLIAWKNINGEPVELKNLQQQLLSEVRKLDSELPPASSRTPRPNAPDSHINGFMPNGLSARPSPSPRRVSRLHKEFEAVPKLDVRRASADIYTGEVSTASTDLNVGEVRRASKDLNSVGVRRSSKDLNPSEVRKGSKNVNVGEASRADRDSILLGGDVRRAGRLSNFVEADQESFPAVGRHGRGSLAARAQQIDNLPLMRRQSTEEEDMIQVPGGLWGSLVSHPLFPQQPEQPSQDKTVRRRSSIGQRRCTSDF